MDEDQLAGRAKDQSGVCDCDDPSGKNVRKEQDGDDCYWDGLVELLRLYILVIGFLVHSPQSS